MSRSSLVRSCVLAVAAAGIAAGGCSSGETAGRTLADAGSATVRGLGGLARVVGLVAFFVVLAAAAVGDEATAANLAPVAVYVVFWVGLLLVSGLVSDLWRVMSPFDTLAALGRLRPLFDGFGSHPGLYNWVKPPKEFAEGNRPPDTGQARIAFGGTALTGPFTEVGYYVAASRGAPRAGTSAGGPPVALFVAAAAVPLVLGYLLLGRRRHGEKPPARRPAPKPRGGPSPKTTAEAKPKGTAKGRATETTTAKAKAEAKARPGPAETQKAKKR